MDRLLKCKSQSRSQLVDCSVSEDLRLVRRLGHGNSTVFLAVHRRTNKPFAVKVMNKGLLRQRNAYKTAATEREILLSLDHPFLPSLLTHFESENHTFLAMKYCSGGDINILRHSQPTKTFSESAIRFYAAEVVVALEYLHDQGIVYRDLKPENILVQDSGHIMLTDFDLSLRLNSEKDGEWKSRSFVGTEEYIAPEILWGEPHSHAVDWWSLGVFLYEMSHGRTPFRGSRRKDTFVNILSKEPAFSSSPSSPLNDLIRKLLVKEPANRLNRNQVKSHHFFGGLRWDELQFVSRPPFVPPALNFHPEAEEDEDEDDEADMSIKSEGNICAGCELEEDEWSKCTFREF